MKHEAGPAPDGATSLTVNNRVNVEDVELVKLWENLLLCINTNGRETRPYKIHKEKIGATLFKSITTYSLGDTAQ